LRIAILGLTITSSWGNGHATTFRGLVRGLARRGHDVLFLERDKPWYADNRDLPAPPYGDGQAVGAWAQRQARGVTAFYDIDTPITLAALAAGRCEYLTPELLRGFGLYLSFTGGPTLHHLERSLGARMARPLYCSADPDVYRPDPSVAPRWDMGYLGTYSPDRQPVLDELLCRPAAAWPEGRFVVAGPQYPDGIAWPGNAHRVQHLPPDQHRAFYAAQRYTLNVTRADMKQAGYSPSVRVFEAACCGVPIISDEWPGLDTFFVPGQEILTAGTSADVLHILRTVPDAQRRAIAAAARARALAGHTGDHRAAELEGYAHEAAARRVRA
jgi:spore maturation protein CgeB